MDDQTAIREKAATGLLSIILDLETKISKQNITFPGKDIVDMLLNEAQKRTTIYREQCVNDYDLWLIECAALVYKDVDLVLEPMKKSSVDDMREMEAQGRLDRLCGVNDPPDLRGQCSRIIEPALMPEMEVCKK